MHLRLGYASTDRVRPVDADVTSIPTATGGGVAHAVQEGGVTALCGAPLHQLSDVPWPGDAEPRCPRCAELVEGYQTL